MKNKTEMKVYNIFDNHNNKYINTILDNLFYFYYLSLLFL